MSSTLAKEKVIFLKYKPDPAAAVPAYDRYTLENVVVRELFGTDADAADTGHAMVYVMDNISVCHARNGRTVAFPRPAKGDRCILHAGTDAEVNMRVAEAGYFNGVTLAHTRIKLK